MPGAEWNVGTTTDAKDLSASASAATVRRIGWLGLPVLIAAFWLGTADSLPEAARILAARAAYATPVLLSVILGVVAARRSRGVERRFWALLSVANAALFACEIILAYWLLAINPAGPPRIAWPFQVLHLLAAVSFLGVLASMTRFAMASATARIRYVADVGVVALVLYVFSLELYVRRIMEPAGATPVHALVGAAYPVIALLMVSGAAINVFGLKMVKWRSWEKLVMIALAVYVCGVFMWPVWYASAAEVSRNNTRGVLDLIQLTGHYVLLMATVYRLTEGKSWYARPLQPFTLSRRRWLSALVPLGGLLAVAIVMIAAYTKRGDGVWLSVYGVMAAGLMGLSLTRSSITALEHGTLFHRSITDPLTGLYNHRYFHDRLRDEVRASVERAEELALVVLDVDNFGHWNTLFGHGEGDRLLVSLAEQLQKIAPGESMVARIGGDEFAVILPQCSAPDANLLAQRLLDFIGIEGGDQPGSVTASAGLAILPEHADTADDLFRLADCAMLWAKERGKNRVVVYEQGRVPDLSTRERIEFLERQARLSSVRALAAAVDARDPATRFHSQSVAVLATRLAVALELEHEHVRLIGEAALMHDVGKIAVNDAILSKAGPLTRSERLRVQEHPAMGQRILSATDMDEILPWVRSHHERWDGVGYPDRISGEDIPFEARILAVCDAYDAMTSDRPYRRALSKAAALQEIDLHMGTQFDPDIAERFIQVMSVTPEGERLPYLDLGLGDGPYRGLFPA